MSWVSGFADKAEQLLVKLDKSAADKLQKKKTSNMSNEAILTEITTVPSFIEKRVRLTPPPSPIKKSLIPQVKYAPSMVNQSQEDEKLIEYLNDDSKSSNQKAEDQTENVLQQDMEQGQVEGERQLLKNEVRILNNELSLLAHRTKAAEIVSETIKLELHDTEKSREILQEEVKSLKSSIKLLEQQNQFLSAQNKRLEEHSSGALQASEQIKQLQQQVEALQDHQNKLASMLESKEQECVRQQLDANSLTERLQELRTEMDQYRARAQRTLSDKEALISELRTNTTTTFVETSINTELLQLREERQSLSEEVQELQVQMDMLRGRLSDTDTALSRVRETAAANAQELGDRLGREVHRRKILEDDYTLQGKELQSAREELAALSARLRDTDAELHEMRSQLSVQPAPPCLPPGELELRLSTLTKTLIQKQTALESATTERNQLRMQLEELELRHRDHLMLLHQAHVISANDTDDVKAQVPSFLLESPFDTGMTRRVKRAYSSLDAVSIRTGVFLRRYPLARIFVIIYVVMLHMLVLLVLFSGTPDNAQIGS